MHNSQLDSLDFPEIHFGYNLIESPLSDKPRFVQDSINSYVTLGGKLCKRPGSLGFGSDSLITGKRIDRLWLYETLETPANIYIVASMYNLSMAVWEMWYYQLGSVAWTQFPNLRSINTSTMAHEAVAQKGLFYVKGYPSSASSEKLGTVIFDGTDKSFKFWGLLPPTVPAALAGAVCNLTADMDSVTPFLQVTNVPGFPPTPFNIQVDFELMTCLSIPVAGTYLVLRGVNGTIAVGHTAGTLAIWKDWTASAHQVDVNIGWAYTYAYKSVTGQYSNRAPLETNVDKLPSRTGPFQDLIPKFVVQGTADTTNIPEIGIFRSTDGGGTFFFLEDIPNTGAGSITYSDDSFESGVSGGIFQDPVPDDQLNIATVATTLTSNSPPPTVLTPKVTGVDTPINSTPLASYAARIWLGLGNVVFYSGNEEITLGIPEESWPSGTFGNFFRYQYPVMNLAATSDYLYVFTTKGISQLSGTNRETFNSRPVFDNLGAPYSQPRAITRFGEVIAFLTQDLRIGFIQNSTVTIVSDPLAQDIPTAAADGLLFDLKYFGEGEKEWLVVAGHDITDSTNSRQWVYDIKKSSVLQDVFWQSPWSMRLSAMASGQIWSQAVDRRLLLAYYDPSGGGRTNLSYLDPSLETATDFFIDTAVGYEFNVNTNLFTVPTGDHVNKFREPFVVPVNYATSLDRIRFAGDTDPDINHYLDDLWSNPIPAIQIEPPQRRAESVGYKTMLVGTETVCTRVAININKSSPLTERFECMNLIIAFAPDLGGGE